jgi:Flp pilus assembly pilin Flp
VHGGDLIGDGDRFALVSGVTQDRDRIMVRLTHFAIDESGVEVIEYALLVGLVAAGCMLALGDLKDGIVSMFSSMADTVGNTLQ